MNMKQDNHFLIAYIFLLTVFVNRADAYVDPNTGGFFLDAIFPVAFCILFIVPWIWALIDIMKNEFSGYNKVMWLLVVRVVPVLGFILYFLIGRKQKIQIKASYALSSN